MYRWYKGAILPSIDNLLKLSELYNLHMEELLIKTNQHRFVFEVEEMKSYNFEERIRAYYFKLTA